MRFVRTILLIILMDTLRALALRCDEILELPAEKHLSIEELHTIPPKDMMECLAHLSKEPLAIEEADFIWQTMISEFGGIENIPDKLLIILHYVTIAVKPEHYANITFTNIDVIENFGLDYGLEPAQLSALAYRVREDFAGKQPEDYTFYDLTAMKHILCQFNRSEIERIHPSAYREAALTIGKLKDCGADAMSGFATLAIQTKAFGPPAAWTEATIKMLGNVADFLPPQIVSKIMAEAALKH